MLTFFSILFYNVKILILGINKSKTSVNTFTFSLEGGFEEIGYMNTIAFVETFPTMHFRRKAELITSTRDKLHNNCFPVPIFCESGTYFKYMDCFPRMVKSKRMTLLGRVAKNTCQSLQNKPL